MSLQDIFKEYYTKAKAVDTHEYVNSAKTKLNSFSSLLEQRRQKAMRKQEEADAAKSEAKEEAKAEAKTEFKEAQEAPPKDEAGAKEEAPRPEESAQAKTEEAKTEEAKAEPKPRWHEEVREKLNQKTSAFSSTMNEKFPKTVTTTSKAFNYFKEVWRETFPDD